MPSVPFVGFRIGAEVHLAVDARRVRGVARAAGIVPVPFARRWVAGVLVREGRVVPVLDLSRVPSLWNKVPEGGGDQVIVVAGGEVEAGFLAADAETFTGDDVVPGGDAAAGAARAPAAVRQAILSCARTSSGRDYGVLRVEAALAAAEVPAG